MHYDSNSRSHLGARVFSAYYLKSIHVWVIRFGLPYSTTKAVNVAATATAAVIIDVVVVSTFAATVVMMIALVGNAGAGVKAGFIGINDILMNIANILACIIKMMINFKIITTTRPISKVTK